MSEQKALQRLPAEIRFADELATLKQQDTHPVPPGWQLSPIAVERFICGDPQTETAPKFVAKPGVVRRVVISLCAGRGGFLVGEPGTAKSWLSELLAAAISGDSNLIIQGSTISATEQLLYSWDQARLSQQGYHPDALIPGPLYRAMRDGKLLRFEELSRCPQPLQDALLSALSERLLTIPELADNDGVLFAHAGFNVMATSNSADEGVNRMSVALRRRLSFETIEPIQALQDEIDVVRRELASQNKGAGIQITPDDELIDALVTLFHELRSGQSIDGRSIHRLAGATLSTAEAINVAHALSIHAWYYGNGAMDSENLLHFLLGSALKDQQDDRRRLKQYFESEVAHKKGRVWQQLYQYKHLI